MKIRDMAELPQQAGLAKLVFEPADPPQPGLAFTPAPLFQREGDVITLEYVADSEFVPLQDGNQFLYRHPASAYSTEIYFGGTDEALFLTRVALD